MISEHLRGWLARPGDGLDDKNLVPTDGNNNNYENPSNMYAANRIISILRIVGISNGGSTISENRMDRWARPGDGLKDKNRAPTNGNNNNLENRNNMYVANRNI